MLRPPAAALSAFSSHFDEDATHAADAGGRVNVIGEHVDYHQGLVLPLALSLRTWALVRPRTDTTLRIASRHFTRHLKDELTLDTAALAAEPAQLQARLTDGWHRHAVGALWALRARGTAISGADVWIDGDLPLGAGLASSAAIGVALATVFAALAGETLKPRDVAAIAQRGEHAIVGVACGIMDPLASALGSADGRACYIDCRSLDAKSVTVRASLAFLIVSSGRTHTLAAGDYARRQAECAAALQRLEAESARDLTLVDLFPLEGTALGRLRHVVTEIDRVRRAVDALEAGDHAELGALMYASHASLKEDYEVSCPELDAIVEAARPIDGVYGARLTGGGFGGNAIVACDRSRVGPVRARLRKRFGVSEVSAGGPPALWIA